MEAPLLNIGDYEGMDNIGMIINYSSRDELVTCPGGTFPVGEVISESKDLLTVSGKLSTFNCIY